MKDLDVLLSAVQIATQEFNNELLKQFPKGTRVLFTIMHNQRHLTLGEVVSEHSDVGFLHIKHLDAKHGSRYSHRRVHYSNLLLD